MLHERKRERVVSGGHGRVRRENGRSADLGERHVPRLARRERVAHPLKNHECGVAFIQVPRGWLQPERAERQDAAESQDDFLLQADFLAAAVETGRQLAIGRRVLRQIGVEQQQPDPAELYLPHLHEHGAIAERHEDDARLFVERAGFDDGRLRPVELLVDLFLPAVGRHTLAEVALRIHEADADDRHAEVAGFLAVITGEDAEAARVDRQRLVQRELGAEVRDDLRRRGIDRRVPPRAPGRRRGVIGVARSQGRVV